ncbi:hypothetical protein BO79DRAFT_256843 [Aspergillus costaricaensis CBS 115574]|uniref:Uncharacterized protein n=1 Tax=Aspergillus costaricaensis CBS 115574 TaxID=1448317 RepID=A0ACD1I8N8_9EURO|nr:hypothetical protein BO79DRAFT_256843 [Aspergillus costaricaensis CBS 115574]RAK86901.1 hypothetical protein BO79DRAFT_256843 [Aspergillus costaricaensis CBS 115574]
MKIASSSVSQHTELFYYVLDKLTASSKRNLEEMISRVFRSLVLRFILTQSTLSITVAPLAIDTNHNLSDPGVDMINAE